MNDHQLLERAKEGQLSRAEVSEVARALRHKEPGRDRYTLLHILGWSGAVQYRELVEQMLESPDDPMVAGMAIEVLCSHWDLSEEHEPTVVRFAKGVEWDSHEEVRLIALSAAGELLRTKPASALKSLLWSILSSPTQSHLARKVAYHALARGSGKSWNELPRAPRVFDLEKGLDPVVVAWAKQ